MKDRVVAAIPIQAAAGRAPVARDTRKKRESEKQDERAEARGQDTRAPNIREAGALPTAADLNESAAPTAGVPSKYFASS